MKLVPAILLLISIKMIIANDTTKSIIKWKRNTSTNNFASIRMDGSYKFAYQTDNGIHHEEEEDNNGYVKGRYTYKSPEGQLIDLKYEADVNGFRPSGIHLPTSPPIPDAFFLAIRLHELASGNGIEKPPLFYS